MERNFICKNYTIDQLAEELNKRPKEKWTVIEQSPTAYQAKLSPFTLIAINKNGGGTAITLTFKLPVWIIVWFCLSIIIWPCLIVVPALLFWWLIKAPKYMKKLESSLLELDSQLQ